MTDQEKAIAYYKSGATQARTHQGPPYVPSRVRLVHRIRSDIPFLRDTYVDPGEYPCECNKWGAVSVRANDDSMLGLRLDEFEPVEWRENGEAYA
jgi:hypothetical protein